MAPIAIEFSASEPETEADASDSMVVADVADHPHKEADNPEDDELVLRWGYTIHELSEWVRKHYKHHCTECQKPASLGCIVAMHLALCEICKELIPPKTGCNCPGHGHEDGFNVEATIAMRAGLQNKSAFQVYEAGCERRADGPEVGITEDNWKAKRLARVLKAREEFWAEHTGSKERDITVSEYLTAEEKRSRKRDKQFGGDSTPKSEVTKKARQKKQEEKALKKKAQEEEFETWDSQRKAKNPGSNVWLGTKKQRKRLAREAASESESNALSSPAKDSDFNASATKIPRHH